MYDRISRVEYEVSKCRILKHTGTHYIINITCTTVYIRNTSYILFKNRFTSMIVSV